MMQKRNRDDTSSWSLTAGGQLEMFQMFLWPQTPEDCKDSCGDLHL